MKLWTVIKYELWTALRPLLIFWAIMYGIVAVLLILFKVTGHAEFRLNGLEISSFIYLGIFGNLGFHEDFRMLIQNGFTRKYIYAGAAAMFTGVTAMMAAVDTMVPELLGMKEYHTLFVGLYGEEHVILIQWLWLFLLYFTVSVICYFLTLISNKIGKKNFWFLLILTGAVCLILLPVIISRFLPDAAAAALTEAVLQLAGFDASGRVALIWPLGTLLFICITFAALSYGMIRKTEIKGA